MKKTKRIHIVESGPRTVTKLLKEVMRVYYDFDFVSVYENSIRSSNLNIGKNLDLILTKHPVELSVIENPLKIDPQS